MRFTKQGPSRGSIGWMMAVEGQLVLIRRSYEAQHREGESKGSMLGEAEPRSVASRNTLPQLILAHTHTRASPTKCLVPVNRGKISRRGDIIAVIESQHGTDPCVLQTLPNDPA